MTDYGKLPKGQSRTLIDYNNVLNRSGEKTFICVDTGVLPIITQLLSTRGMWRTSYIIDRDNVGYFYPNIDQFDPISTLIGEFIDEVNTMATCNSFVDAVNRIADVLAACNCGTSNAGTRVYVVGSNRGWYYGTQQPLDNSTGVPDGFADRAEYLDYRCSMANGFVDAVISNCNGMSLFGGFESMAAALAASLAVGLLAFPPVALLGILAAAIAVGGGSWYAFNTLANWIEDNRQSWVDTLACSDNAALALDGIYSILGDTNIQAFGFEVDLGTLADVIVSMIPIDKVNQIYSKAGLPPIGNANWVQCSCTDCGWVELGTPKDVCIGGQYTITAEVNPQDGYYTVRCGSHCNARIVDCSLSDPIPYYYEIVSNEGYYVSHYRPNPATVYHNVTYMNIPATSSFTATIDFS